MRSNNILGSIFGPSFCGNSQQDQDVSNPVGLTEDATKLETKSYITGTQHKSKVRYEHSSK